MAGAGRRRPRSDRHGSEATWTRGRRPGRAVRSGPLRGEAMDRMGTCRGPSRRVPISCPGRPAVGGGGCRYSAALAHVTFANFEVTVYVSLGTPVNSKNPSWMVWVVFTTAPEEFFNVTVSATGNPLPDTP